MAVEDGDQARAQSPLLGVILCCTSISPEERSELASVAAQMGATHKFDLTSDVTHLLVGSLDTPKYKYVAKERPDVKVVLPAWVEAVRRSWMAGGDTDVASLEQEYRVPTLYGLLICVTGFEDLVQRQQIADAVEQNGAQFQADLTKDVTHLIAASPRGKKYDFARQRGVRVVALEWLADSLQRGMVLDESLYDPLMPKNERGKGAWKQQFATTTHLGKRDRAGEESTETSDGNKRKLRRTASTKLGSQSELLWNEITRAAFEPTDEEGNHEVDQGENAVTANGRTGPEEGSLIRMEPSHGSVNQAKLKASSATGLFQGRAIFVHGFDRVKRSILHEHLKANGAFVLENEQDFTLLSHDALRSGIAILPHDVPRDDLPKLPDAASGLIKATEWWAESCLHHKLFIEPADDVFSRPFPTLSIEGFNKDLIVSSSSFAGIDLLHISKAVKLMGATYDEYLKPTASVLICNRLNPNREKIQFAFSRNIPVVSIEWLWACVQTGKKQPITDFTLPPLDGTSQQPYENRAHLTVATEVVPHDQDGRGVKGKPGLQQSVRQKPGDSSASKVNGDKDPRGAKEHVRNTKEVDPGSATWDALTIVDGATLQSANASRPSSVAPTSRAPSERLKEPTKDDDQARQSPSPEEETLRANTEAEVPANRTEEPNPAENLGDTIAALLAERQSARPPSAMEQNRDRRRRGLLGRARSTTSNPSVTASLSRANSLDVGGSAENGYEGGVATTVETPELLPSQALVYEDPSVQRQREMLIRKTGGTIEDVGGGMTVQRIGLVKDAVAEEGVGSRVKRRGRHPLGMDKSEL